jgi:hypothetical protein
MNYVLPQKNLEEIQEYLTTELHGVRTEFHRVLQCNYNVITCL